MNDRLDDMPLSFALYDKDEQLLGARISTDHQWRFPKLDSVPHKFEVALLTFEDKDFYQHFGVDLRAIVRAVLLNFKHKKIVSGASTISMQLMRLHDTRAPRTLVRKIFEIFGAVKFECHNTKEDILLKYITHAPFGGNIVGLEAASWRYLGKSPSHLSWAESCMLAVLPNAPSLIHLGKNRSQLLTKRNKLLKRLLDLGYMDQIDYNLAILEEIAPRPSNLPNIAPHLLEYVRYNHDANKYLSTIDFEKQSLLVSAINTHHEINKQKGIYNVGAIVVNNFTNSIEAYVGNTGGNRHENANNMVERPRSSGSILKPILYALAIEEGLITPNGLAMDVPLSIGGFSPQNYSRTFSGVEKYSNVIAKSLNVPSVSLLQQYGVNRFLYVLREMGFNSLSYDENHYGLPLILGGGEVSLIDLVSAYSGMANILNTYIKKSSRYTKNQFKATSCNLLNFHSDEEYVYDPQLLSASSIWAMLQAMKKVVRPNSEGQWERYENAKPVHWKTGTSYGNKDAWAIGITPKYTVGIWVGNSDGTPQPDIIGASSAGSLMFDVFNFLDISEDFKIPYDDMSKINVCKHSGQVASQNCNDIIMEWMPSTCLSNQICQYCKSALLDVDTRLAVFRDCAPTNNLIDTSFFVLPPLAAHYYKMQNPTYQGFPKYHESCSKYANQQIDIAFEYPREDVSVYIPIDLSGVKEKCVFKAQHKDKSALVYWHLDEKYLGTTSEIHHMAVALNAGDYKLTIEDERGQQVSQWITVVSD